MIFMHQSNFLVLFIWIDICPVYSRKGIIMPPSGFSVHVVKGALQFVGGCYRVLLQEVRDGKHADFEQAIEFELGQIEKALDHIHINNIGELVDRYDHSQTLVLK